MQEWVRTPSRFGVFFSITITRRPGTSESKAAPDHCSVPRTDGKGNVYPRVHAIPSHQLDPVHLDLPAHHLPQSEEPSTGTHRARAPRSMRHLTRMTPNRPAGAATRRRRRADSAAARRRPPRRCARARHGSSLRCFAPRAPWPAVFELEWQRQFPALVQQTVPRRLLRLPRRRGAAAVGISHDRRELPPRTRPWPVQTDALPRLQ